MYTILPFSLFLLSITIVPSAALPELRIRSKPRWNLSLPKGLRPSSWFRSVELEKRADVSGINYNPDGSPFLWLPQDTYAGKTFFDRWDFFEGADPTGGTVNYVNQSTAVANGYIFVEDDGTVIMKADDNTTLPMGVNRDSVRITSQAQYNTGLFILDLTRAPWGCAIWPAFWTVGGDWPKNGEIDILEGVHDNQYNQIAWHTNPGCVLDSNVTFSGTIPVDNGQNRTNCDANVNSNSGCDVVEWSRASYGPFFEAQGGGILAMKWDENDISIWSFYRAAIPTDVAKGTPNPSSWGAPSAMLKNTLCDIPTFFANHSIVFDITFCGAWAGNSYATSGCPGTCPERLMDPTNFVNATWSINSLKVFQKQLLTGNSTTSAASPNPIHTISKTEVVLPLVAALIYNFW